MEMGRDRYQGCLIGLAFGDALATTLEFKRPGTFKPIKEMVGGGPFGLKPGEWTDDTSMALCLAESRTFSLPEEVQGNVSKKTASLWEC